MPQFVALKQNKTNKYMKNKTLQLQKNTSLMFAITALIAVTSFTGIANAENPSKPGTTEANAKTGDIVAVAMASSKFTTLCTALKAAGLVETLQGKGPFTVFAPTNEAFAKLPKGTLDDLLKPENKKKLAAILTYHVLPGKVMAADIKTMQAKTVNGQRLDIKVEGGKVTVDEAKVITTDVAASNGVIHAIDTVLMPK
jgi:uncharacterized surface protein with fasciclin (FAS1) repeats